MSKIAADVVLLPSEKVANSAIKANRELQKQLTGRIILDKKTCLPHISLVMGCIHRSEIANIGKILRELAEEYPPGKLFGIGIHIGSNSIGETVSVLELKRTEPLQALHEQVIHRLKPYLSYDVTADMLLSPTGVCESTLRWIREFPEKSSFKSFFPHITLGYGKLDEFPFPAEFKAQSLSLCHLGNHCTCKKILASVEFPS